MYRHSSWGKTFSYVLNPFGCNSNCKWEFQLCVFLYILKSCILYTESNTHDISKKNSAFCGFKFCFLWVLIGDRVLIIIQVRQRRFFIVLGFTVVSRCILRNGCRENLEHRRRWGESGLRKTCNTRASTYRLTIFLTSSLPFVVCSTFYYCKIIVILFMCNIEYINSSFISVLVSMNIYIPYILFNRYHLN